MNKCRLGGKLLVALLLLSAVQSQIASTTQHQWTTNLKESKFNCTQEGSHCHSRAICMPRTGQCACSSGYTGDGRQCRDIDECIQDSHACPSEQVCINAPGSYICCGKQDDADACLAAKLLKCKSEKDCKPNSVCEEGWCTCQNGYYMSEMEGCSDVNECTSYPNICPNDTQCINFSGSFACCTKEQSLSQCLGVVIFVPKQKTGQQIPNGLEVEQLSTLASQKVTPRPLETAAPTLDKPTRLNISQVQSSCKAKQHHCHSNARCVLSSPSQHEYICVCDKGFEGDGYNCRDVDECTLSDNLCSPLATCVNTIGSYKCVCKPGYSGDGITCTPSCPHGHKPLAMTCSLGPNRKQCLKGYDCIHGFCCPSDIGEGKDCSKNPLICHQSANCLNGMCYCKSGFHGNGYVCEDVDECALGTHTCLQHLQCLNTIGSYKCVTKSIGLPNQTLHNCSSVPTICAPNAVCKNQLCVCKHGYIGDGLQCNPDPTNCLFNRSICDPNARCIEGQCQCSPGYIGNGRKCFPDPKDCHVDIQLCSKYARCVDRRCECIPGFSGDGIDCTVVPVPDQENCTLNSGICQEWSKCILGRCVCDITSTHGQCNGNVSATLDCRNDPSICHRHAVCSGSVCICKQGYTGNGLNCLPVGKDCVLNPNVCSPDATCVSGQCLCKQGYTGNGITCSPIATPAATCEQNPEKCSVNAICRNGECICKQGYIGNGSSCVVDANDCLMNPGICPANAQCFMRRCLCNAGYEGDGKSCTPVVKSCQHGCDPNSHCFNGKCVCNANYVGDGLRCFKSTVPTCSHDASICDYHAECKKFGNISVCICNEGFEGTGLICKATSSKNLPKTTLGYEADAKCASLLCGTNAECKLDLDNKPVCRCLRGFSGNGFTCQDINECQTKIHKCHWLATCENTIGSYRCICPTGYNGDGKSGCFSSSVLNNSSFIDAQCEHDGITLHLKSRAKLQGKIYVKSQSGNQVCSQQISQPQEGAVFKFKARFDACDVKKVSADTYSVVVVIQRHRAFVTKDDEAYKLVCTYPTAERQVNSGLSVKMLSTTDTYTQSASSASCALNVIDPSTSEPVLQATVGQKLRMQLVATSIGDNQQVIPRNCMVVNMENGERYPLTDQNGCSLDSTLFPNWQTKSRGQLYSDFSTFKWPETAIIQFQCDCSICMENCARAVSDCHVARTKRSLHQPSTDVRLSSNNVRSNALTVFSSEKVNGDSTDENSASVCMNGWLYVAFMMTNLILLITTITMYLNRRRKGAAHPS
ncbi:hypothetical protein M513_03635 [Trichuris suis]|uniref:EGF-like domain protein n=1 Tax=Trichuris suis TaxID=68888 RepID=A0A085MED7_9BILA|nr:hypothetical protein M513_03635 [Trichuris suis]